MEEQFLNDLGKFLVVLVRAEIDRNDRARFSKSPRIPKNPAQYRVNASGKLKDSVGYKVENGEILIVMNDYGVNNVFQIDSEAGSFPGGGRYATGRGTGKSLLIPALTQWAKAKFKKSEKESRSIAFAVRKNLFKSGYGGVPLVDENFQNLTLTEINNLLDKDEYREALSNEFLDGLLDRITILGKSSYGIIFGEE